jgi:branched-chain amino acid transport system ATP-binding protein
VLKIRSLDVAYGGLQALSAVSLDVEQGEFVAVGGPNGAGKSTLFKTISGTVAPAAGQITYKGLDLLALPPAERAQRGIAHVPEGRQVFASMTVMENLEMGAYTRNGRGRWRELLPVILALFPVLDERREQLAGTLSGGEQQMLAIGRGLASAPELLMLDEPSMGLAPAVVDAIFERIHQIHRDHGLTILLVEQRVAEALESCDRGYVLETGKVVMQGRHDELVADPRV